MTDHELLEQAVIAQQKALAKYSNFRVGAALETQDGKIYLGANIENASYSLTVCAERTALFQAVLNGERDFNAIAVVSDSKDFTPPCGACRQVLIEHSGGDLDVCMFNKNGKIKKMNLHDLLTLSIVK